jgi:hypothetical protein
VNDFRFFLYLNREKCEEADDAGLYDLVGYVNGVATVRVVKDRLDLFKGAKIITRATWGKTVFERSR